MESTTKVEQAGTTGWWRREGQSKVPVTPGESGEGPHLCDEAAEIVAGWAGEMVDHFAEAYEWVPTHVTLENLLASGIDCLPDWADGEAIAEDTEQVRTRLAALYEAAWGRPPSMIECSALVSGARQRCAWIA